MSLQELVSHAGWRDFLLLLMLLSPVGFVMAFIILTTDIYVVELLGS